MTIEKKRLAGLNITEDFLRIADIEISEKSVSVFHLFEYPMFQNLDLRSKETKKIVSELKRSVRKLQIPRSAYISADNKYIILKEKTLPPVGKQEIFKLIDAEIKDYAIFNHENVSLGFNVVKKEKDKISIIWAGIKESLLMRTLSIVKSMGVKPFAVVPSNFAIAKFILHFYPKSDNFVVIDVDNSTTSLTFVNNGKVVLNYKHDVGLSDLKDGNPEAVNSWVGNILTTITFVSRNRKIPIGKIFLISQNGNPEKLLPFLSSRISYPIVIPDLKSLLNFKREEDFLKVQETGGTEFIVPIGLALLEEGGTKDPLFCDISKHILVEKASIRVKVVVTALLLIVVNAAAIYYYPFLSSTLNSLSSNLEKTNKRIEIAQKQAENTEKIKNELSALVDTLNKYKLVRTDINNRVVSSALLSELESKLPEGVNIVNISVGEDGKIAISGVGRSYKDVLQYEVNLSSAKFVKDASVTQMAKSTSNVVIFNLVAKTLGENNEKK